MDRVQLVRPTAGRIRPLGDPIVGPSLQRIRLTNGRYCVLLGAAGSGGSECDGVCISRYVQDRTCDSDGFHVYLRDLEDGFVWSAGYQPTRVEPSTYEFQFSGSLAEIVRVDRDVECRFSVCISQVQNVELRRCRLTNLGRPRQIELTSYLEFVLGSRDFDANHPAFSKLFIETEYWSERQTILARRRPRGADEPEHWGFHRLILDPKKPADEVQFETSRVAFIGRGRNTVTPRALDWQAQITGCCGPVLDPIGSLRTTVSLAAGETRDVVFLLGAAPNRAAIEELAVAIEDMPDARLTFAAAAQDGSAINGNASRWISHPPHGASQARGGRAVSERNCLPAFAVVTEVEGAPLDRQEPLQFENGIGGFSADGREYVLRLEPAGPGALRLPPQPWTNVIANEKAGCLVTERGAGYTWAGNSRHNRLTNWHNDPVCDPHAEALWIRDEEADVFWSPTPGPTPAEARYEVRHGFGYTKFLHNSLGLAQETTVFMAPDDPVKLVTLRIENRGPSNRRLTVFSFAQWSLGTLAPAAGAITTEFDQASQAILARHPNRDLYGEYVAFSAVVTDAAGPGEISYTADRTMFLGRHGDLTAPAAVAEWERLDKCTGGDLDCCAAWQVPLEIPAGAAVECTIVLGEAADGNSAKSLVEKFRQPGRVKQTFDEVQMFWRDLLSAVEIETPDREIDLLVNGWLPYQNVSCRLWGRSAYYQPGGAFGFRDQLQDVSALIFHRPDLTRRQIVRNAGQQFLEGDVMHWWHEDSRVGLRTRFSDDLAWLPLVTAEYIRATGDEAVLDEVTPFLVGPQLAPKQLEFCLRGEPAGESATVYEHCCRALDRALTAGPHGLPLIGSGDWNDGMNRVGRDGTGESVWLGFFLTKVIDEMLPICERRKDGVRVERYREYRNRMVEVVNDAGWDGQWYRRAYYDNGQAIGSAECDECQIDALAQAWAVLSGVAPSDRAELAVQAVEERLVDEDAGLIRLLTPPFDRTPHDPGYIKGYVAGVRENGGQYTHGVLWFIRALAEMGRGSRAVELLRMISPISHTESPERVATYQTEPYVVAADIYSEPPHAGRGGWTWYTGSAGWMFRVAVESIMGLSMEGGKTIVLKPAISSNWPSCRLKYRLPDGRTRYEITIENPNGKESGVSSASLDGETLAVEGSAARIPIVRDGHMHQVVVRL